MPRCLPYAELQVTSNFSFLTGASHPEELIEQAAALGHAAVAITDRNSLAGIVRAHVAAKESSIPLAVGCRLLLQAPDAPATSSRLPNDELSVLVYATDRPSYSRLCWLLTLGKRRAPKGDCYLTPRDLCEFQEGLLAVAVPPLALDPSFANALRLLRDVFGSDRLSLAASCAYGPDDAGRLRDLAALSAHHDVPLAAVNDVHCHIPARRMLQDVLTCIRHGCTLDEAGLRLMPHAERHLKTPEEMTRLFADYPEALRRSVEIARIASQFSLDELRYEYPDEICPAGMTPMRHLVELTWKCTLDRYPRGVPEKVRRQIEHEFSLIEELNYAPYFLTVHDLVKFARSQHILCQGRGAAANSAVCYCLGLTAVDPDRVDILFERFVSRERNEPPDIDIDFEHERREEVIQYIYRKYGRDRAALTAEVISYRGRSAVREVGKALGLSLDAVDRMAKNIDWWRDGFGDNRRIGESGVNPDDPTIRHLIKLVNEIIGFPRHLSQHVGGFVITRSPLCELVPIENAAMEDRTIIEWDKDDIDAMGMLKVDVLGLGMLTCIRKAMALVSERRSQPLELHTIPPEDPAVYDMICAADVVGVFQIESRAQMSMLPRLRPRCYYDLVIEVAIVRPGPIQGDMVHPYLRRRNGEEPVTYPDEAVKEVLSKTLGVPLFQEQAMALAMVAAGFTAGEADRLRRAIASVKRKRDQVIRMGEKLVNGMLQHGYPKEFAERCFRQIQGFSEYGFPESHAASFALLVYASAWLKKHHPAVFAAALINSQPMGFYAPAQIIRDVKEHGVEVRPADVNFSRWDCTLEYDRPDDPESPALRLGMRLIKGLREEHADVIGNAVDRCGRFDSIEALRRQAALPKAALKKLAQADAFNSMGLDRQRALWRIHALRDEDLPMFAGADEVKSNGREGALLPAISPPRQVVQDYAAMRLSLKAHPISFLREMLDGRGIVKSEELKDEKRSPNGRWARVAGLVLVRQRPATAAGIVFMTLEDETGIANLVVRPQIFEKYRKAARHGVAVVAHGKVERQGEVVNVVVKKLEDLDRELNDLAAKSRNFR
ncbi:MAG: error-prone DNA polymerase [Phycisphaerales bacterium]|nr:MAG: error-prone DNA polymerase [Phycisphaerales bacterium]